MYIILGIMVFVIILFLYSACVISGRCSREEEKQNELQQLD